MDCATFENRLTELLEGRQEGEERRRRLDELRRHAARCVTCGGSEELLQLLALPPGERDLATDPGPEYWTDFDRRLRERIEATPRAVSTRSRWAGLVAATIVLALAAAWLLSGTGGDGPTESPAIVDLVEEDPIDAGKTELLQPLLGSLDRATAAEVTAQLDALDDPVWEGGGPFPDLTDLDADARQELLGWLREQSS